MVTLYVIKNAERSYRYVGITKDLERRLVQHARGHTKSTKGRGPFRVILTEQFPNHILARKREKFLKSGVGRMFLGRLE